MVERTNLKRIGSLLSMWHRFLYVSLQASEEIGHLGLVLRTQRHSSDHVVLDQADPPFADPLVNARCRRSLCRLIACSVRALRQPG